MLKCKHNGQEGYFLTEEQYQQIKHTFEVCSSVAEKVIQDANNS